MVRRSGVVPRPARGRRARWRWPYPDALAGSRRRSCRVDQVTVANESAMRVGYPTMESAGRAGETPFNAPREMNMTGDVPLAFLTRGSYAVNDAFAMVSQFLKHGSFDDARGHQVLADPDVADSSTDPDTRLEHTPRRSTGPSIRPTGCRRSFTTPTACSPKRSHARGPARADVPDRGGLTCR